MMNSRQLSKYWSVFYRTMLSQSVWIGITIGVFFAGLLIGYATIQTSAPTVPIMNSQQMQQLLNDPQFMNQWQQHMMQNPPTRTATTWPRPSWPSPTLISKKPPPPRTQMIKVI